MSEVKQTVLLLSDVDAVIIVGIIVCLLVSG